MAAGLLGHPDEVMRPARLAMLPPTRLSASRSLVNTMIAQRWAVELRRLDIDDRARGEAVYRVTAGGHVLEFVVFSADPAPGRRSGRIIATDWDMTGMLVEGRATAAQIESARREMPKLYRGRADRGTLLWCRSNRSERSFGHTVRRLAAGRQPDVGTLAGVGYLMRNVALEGNGAFGTRSYLSLGEGHPLRAPYHAEMLAAYLIREFSVDLAQHLARYASGQAAVLAPGPRRYLGLGNGSALGLVMYVNNHPMLVDRWLSLRDAALTAACDLTADPDGRFLGRLDGLLGRAIVYHAQDRLTYTGFTRPTVIAGELRLARRRLAAVVGRAAAGGATTRLGDVLGALTRGIDQAAVEVIRSLAIELVPAEADRLAAQARCEEVLPRAPDMPLAQLRAIVAREYAWALRTDLDAHGARAYAWYRSRLAEEPRRGLRQEVTGGHDWALDLPGDLQRLMADTAMPGAGPTVGEFLAFHPHHRATVQRVQGLRGRHYHSPHMNMADEGFAPMQITRLVNAAFQGLDKTVNYRDRAVLGVLFQGAPSRDELPGWQGDWCWPAEPPP